jgi:hypothetical protein
MRKKHRQQHRPEVNLRTPRDDLNFAKRLAEGAKVLYTEMDEPEPSDYSRRGLLRKLERMGL